MQRAAQFELVLAVRGLEAEALGPGAHDRRRFLGGGRGLVLDLELALEHQDLLFLFLEALQELLVGDFLCLRGERQRECRKDGGAQCVLVTHVITDLPVLLSGSEAMLGMGGMGVSRGPVTIRSQRQLCGLIPRVSRSEERRVGKECRSAWWT